MFIFMAEIIFLKIKFFLLEVSFCCFFYNFDVLVSKIILKKYKNIILIYFLVKNTFENNY
jgi:hypothetical protein